MLDAEVSKTKKIIQRKKHPQVINMLKQSVGAITITKRIIDLEINLTISMTQILAPAIKKQLIKIFLR